jgi:hypothetical protein
LLAFKHFPVYINSSFPSKTRKLRNAETAPPFAFHATFVLVSLFLWLRTWPQPQRREVGPTKRQALFSSFFFLLLSLTLLMMFEETAHDGDLA